ncbi:hypothetical protein BDV95DRAFT_619558 [Massariosphaeria phaeospora]|uniref:Uncharacterized protein n=1 Tax=Massariosphaeria phaeospora TaxID=100035 RepID=A0A7C8MJ39_9PLEO|nr:hypothetical protein BDV95DRAFT_619558 [Massariosphaeria phaeospora]
MHSLPLFAVLLSSLTATHAAPLSSFARVTFCPSTSLTDPRCLARDMRADQPDRCFPIELDSVQFVRAEKDAGFCQFFQDPACGGPAMVTLDTEGKEAESTPLNENTEGQTDLKAFKCARFGLA